MKTDPARIFSAMQPTGELHLGNYLGALANWVELSREPGVESFFCVVDQHAQTVEYPPEELRKRVVDLAVSYLAAGVDPERSVVFVQSAVPEHTELAWYLATVTQFGELLRMTQFKDKSSQHDQNVNAALFSYPVLMAADILLYKATVVPVGDDQTQHLELTRDIAHRFNKRYGDTFPLPASRMTPSSRIMGIDGMHKMSKSRGNHIGMLEDDRSIEKKLKRAFTDAQRVTIDIPGRPKLCNIFSMHESVTPEDTRNDLSRRCLAADVGCGECKIVLAKSLSERLRPIRERAAELRAKPDTVIDMLHAGSLRARAIAQETLREVRDRMGVRSFAR